MEILYNLQTRKSIAVNWSWIKSGKTKFKKEHGKKGSIIYSNTSRLPTAKAKKEKIMSGLNTNNLHSKLKIGVSHIKNLNKTYMKINLLFFDVHAYISTECHRI